MKGSSIQNSIYSMFELSKSVVVSCRMIPPQRCSGLRSLPSGVRFVDMAELAVKTKELGYKLEQVQDFTPTPMTLATEIYYSGYDPYTLKPVFVAKSKQEKLDQQRFFFWYKPENRQYVKNALRKIGKALWIDKLFRN